jgi:16S rRNA (guanine527-N7)-methyltransferase
MGAEQAPPLLAALDRLALTAAQRRQLSAVLEVLRRDRHAPTAIREPAAATGSHLADSLAALELEPVRAARHVADVGSGAGFPGVPLAVALPETEVSLIESQRRRCEFLEQLCRAAAIGNVRVVCSRAEEWREGIARHDVVLARALAPQPVVLEYAAPLLRLGGRLVDWRGRRVPDEESAARRAGEELGMRLQEIRRVLPFADARDHHLHIWLKAAETPARFPRRPGIARKRPLGDERR